MVYAPYILYDTVLCVCVSIRVFLLTFVLNNVISILLDTVNQIVRYPPTHTVHKHFGTLVSVRVHVWMYIDTVHIM